MHETMRRPWLIPLCQQQGLFILGSSYYPCTWALSASKANTIRSKWNDSLQLHGSTPPLNPVTGTNGSFKENGFPRPVHTFIIKNCHLPDSLIVGMAKLFTGKQLIKPNVKKWLFKSDSVRAHHCEIKHIKNTNEFQFTWQMPNSAKVKQRIEIFWSGRSPIEHQDCKCVSYICEPASSSTKMRELPLQSIASCCGHSSGWWLKKKGKR